MANNKRKLRVAHILSLATALGALACSGFVVTPGLAATPPCTTEAAQAAAPPGMTVGPINDLNPTLPAVPAGALLVPAAGSTPAYASSPVRSSPI